MTVLRIPGGLVLPPPPAAATGPLRPCPLPAHLYLPLVQADGRPLQRLAAPGQEVRRGQALALGQDAAATALPAPVSGRIVDLVQLDLPGGGQAPALQLQPDGRAGTAAFAPLPDWPAQSPAVLRRRLAEAGITGLGGAGFPTAVKLDRQVQTLILNGAECEPYIGCDDALLQAHAGEVVAGAALLAHIVAAADVVIALEERMREAAAAITAALPQHPGVRLQLVPTVYPQGGERQLIQVVCGREVPSGSWPPAIGVLVHNVATAQAAWRAVVHGEALTMRIVSVGGRGVAAPGNYEVHLGTLVEDLIAAAGGYTAQAARLVLGGPLMGQALPHDRVALDARANSVLVLGADDIRPHAPELACIRCGDCAQACPVQLQPQELLRQLSSGDLDAAAALGLRDCIECGCCAYVCPSQIPLVEGYRRGKSELALRSAERARADLARERYESRQSRLQREQAEKVARVAARRQAVQQEQAASAAASATEPGADAPDAASTTAASTTNAATATTDANAIGATLPTQNTAPATPAPSTAMDKSAVLAAIARGRAKRAAAAATPESTAAPGIPPPDLPATAAPEPGANTEKSSTQKSDGADAAARATQAPSPARGPDGADAAALAKQAASPARRPDDAHAEADAAKQPSSTQPPPEPPP